MKILISYVSAGTGHRRAAESIYNYLKENCKDFQIKLADALEVTSPGYRRLYIYGYQFIIKHALCLWQLSFWFTSSRRLRKLNKILTFVAHRLNIGNFYRLLEKEKPDFIISTHFLPLEVATYLKRKNKINSRIIAVVTDFGVHPVWFNKGTDLYVVASGTTGELLVQKGVDRERIKDLGIPVEEKFLHEYDKVALREKLGLARNKFTVLLITGSFGIGPIEKIIKLLYKDVQVLAVCANNKKLFAKLHKRGYAGVKVYGFIDNVQELMSASDMVITKPGGLSISEILVTELVPVFIFPIPGQEVENIKILKSYGIGFSPSNISEIKDIVLDCKNNPHKLAGVKEKIKALKRPYATRELCNVVCQGSIWPVH